jgi:putative ABC transport system permease protein
LTEFLGDYSELVVSLIILVIILIALYFFLRTRFGLVLRATGDNEHMVRASGTNTDLTKMFGLALSNALVGLSGAMIAQYQRFSDIQMGTGMVVIGLASVIIGEVVFGTRSLLRRISAVALGAVLYRFIIAMAFEIGMPATDLKLVSAVIVALALSAPKIGGVIAMIKKRFSTGETGGDSNA